MIEKIPGNSRIEKLRVIHIFEADYNLLLKIMWAWKIIWKAHSTNKLNNGQAGSRPGRRAIDVALQKELKYNDAVLTRTLLATIDNDAKSCFDRILCNIAMMISRHYGVPENYCKMKATTLKETSYNISTNNGDSEKSYTHNPNNPIHGTGQGSCSSPPIWLMLSSFIMDILEKKGHGMQMHDIQNDMLIIKQWIEGFVDDTSLFTNLPYDNQNLQQLLNQIQHDGQTWEGLLASTGGELELLKCFYYILSWEWDKYGNPVPQTIQQQKLTNLQLKLSKNDKTTSLEQKEVNHSHKTLGTFKCITGSEDTHYKHLLQKSDEFAIRTKNAQINRRQGWLVYSCNYIPAMCCSLTAVNMNYKQLSTIQRKATTQFTRKCGYEMTFPKSVVHGPIAFGGLGFQHIYVESICSKIQTIICLINKKTDLGASIRLLLGWVQLHAGIKIPILEDTTNLNYIQQNWFLEIRNFLIQCNASIKIKYLHKIDILRENNTFIMNDPKLQKLNKIQKQIINNWRLFFQVINLSEMTNYEGNCIRKMYLCEKDMQHMKTFSKMRWPHQQRPNIKTFSVWVNYIKNITNCDQRGKLKTKLGDWIENPHKRIRIKYMIHKNLQHIISSNENEKWNIHSKVNESLGKAYFNLSPQRSDIKLELHNYVPVDTIEQNQTIQIQTRNISKLGSSHKIYKKVELIQRKFSKENMVLSIQQFGKYINNSRIINDFNPCNDNIINIMICSDGGMRNNIATFGIATSLNESIILETQFRLPEIHNNFTSHRREGYGVLGALTILQNINKIKQKHQIIHATIICDNEAIIKSTNKYNKQKAELKDYYRPDFDLLQEIVRVWRILKKQKNKITFQHIKGHQKSNNAREDYKVTLNNRADKLATEAIDNTRKNKNNENISIASLTLHNKQITADQTKILRKAYLSMDIREYMIKTNNWNTNIIDKIWWQNHETALKNISTNKRRFLQKYIHNRLPTNYRQQKYYSYKSNMCRTCNEKIETQDHILKYTHCKIRNIIRKNYILNIKSILAKHRIDINTTLVITHHITNWFDEKENQPLSSLVPDASNTLKLALKEQLSIGWENWIKGRLSIEWGILAKHDIETIDSHIPHNSVEKFAKEITLLGWNFVHDMWIEQNNNEHGTSKDKISTERAKEKMIDEIIYNNHKHDLKIYKKYEMTKEKLEKLCVSNIRVILQNVKEAKTRNGKQRQREK